MRREDISTDLRELAFDFFYWFSRFEFALKENGFLRNEVPGSRAEPGWNSFVNRFEGYYTLSDAGASLVRENPRRQMVGHHGFEFRYVDFDDQPSDLGRIVRLLKTVRNNLFHGGKHGAEGWDDPNRTRKLLTLSITILNELAELGGIEPDYTRYY